MDITPSHLPPALQTSAIVIAALSLFALVIRMVGPWRKQIDDLEARMRKELLTERDRCDAELRMLRHRDRNRRQMIYNLLHLFDLPAARRRPILDSIRAELAAIEQAEAAEAAIVATAGLGEPAE